MFSDHNFGKTHIKPLPSFILHAMNADDAYKPIQRATLSEASWRILRIAQSVELRHPVSHETALAIWGVELPADSDCSVVSLRSSQGGYAGTDVDYGWSGESPAFGHSEHSIRLGQDFPDSDFQYFPDSPGCFSESDSRSSAVGFSAFPIPAIPGETSYGRPIAGSSRPCEEKHIGVGRCDRACLEGLVRATRA